MEEEALTQFKTEGTKPFEQASNETDNSSESSTEKTNGEQTQSQEGKENSGAEKKDATTENLADHPRWQERESDWKTRFNDQEKRHTDEITKLRDEFLGKGKTEETKSNLPVEVPSWFGGDESQWKEYSGHTEKLIELAVTKAVGAIETKSTQEQKRLDDATKFMNDEIATLEADKNINPEGAQIDRNKLLKFVLDEKLVDTEGRWNYRAAFKMMKAGDVFKAKGALDERKKIAGATVSESRAETKPQAFLTSADFKKPENRPW